MNSIRVLVLVVLVIPFTSRAELIQKKYPRILGKPADYLLIINENAKIVPLNQYDSFLSQQNGIANKPANYIAYGIDQIATYPYIIVPDSEYQSYMKNHLGYTKKPANHININGKETIILSSKEINTDFSVYPGIAGKPANHVVIDGQEVIFVKEEKYLGFISQYSGVPKLPSNYVYIDKKIVVVIPINPQDTADIHSDPIPLNVNDDSSVKEFPLKRTVEKKEATTVTPQ